ncbi:MAG: hypothetical protein NT027_14405 [Proteobacteria bacterium]|nr:hypothetical protein [Pseudomonadota bacterium]
MPKKYQLLSFYLFICSTVAHSAEELPDEDHLRGRCRKNISGFYAELYNDSIRAQEVAQLSSKALLKLKPQLDQTDKSLQQHQNLMKTAPFKSSMAQRQDELVAQERLLHEQVESAENLKEKAESDFQLKDSKHRSLSTVIDQIFLRKFVPDPEGLPRKIFHRIDWKDPCPKYKSLCPLPVKTQMHLKTLLKSAPDPDESCKKYLNFR